MNRKLSICVWQAVLAMLMMHALINAEPLMSVRKAVCAAVAVGGGAIGVGLLCNPTVRKALTVLRKNPKLFFSALGNKRVNQPVVVNAWGATAAVGSITLATLMTILCAFYKQEALLEAGAVNNENRCEVVDAAVQTEPVTDDKRLVLDLAVQQQAVVAIESVPVVQGEAVRLGQQLSACALDGVAIVAEPLVKKRMDLEVATVVVEVLTNELNCASSDGLLAKKLLGLEVAAASTVQVPSDFDYVLLDDLDWASSDDEESAVGVARTEVDRGGAPRDWPQAQKRKAAERLKKAQDAAGYLALYKDLEGKKMLGDIPNVLTAMHASLIASARATTTLDKFDELLRQVKAVCPLAEAKLLEAAGKGAYVDKIEGGFAVVRYPSVQTAIGGFYYKRLPRFDDAVVLRKLVGAMGDFIENMDKQ